MDNKYFNKRRLGTTLLPWQQKFCDNQMYFMVDHPHAQFQSNLTCIIADQKQVFTFSQNWLSNHMTSQILLDV